MELEKAKDSNRCSKVIIRVTSTTRERDFCHSLVELNWEAPADSNREEHRLEGLQLQQRTWTMSTRDQ